jgi:hypothetical protein
MSNWQLDLEGIELIEWNNNLSRDKMNYKLNRPLKIFSCFLLCNYSYSLSLRMFFNQPPYPVRLV